VSHLILDVLEPDRLILDVDFKSSFIDGTNSVETWINTMVRRVHKTKKKETRD
jgi:hypothetical protein